MFVTKEEFEHVVAWNQRGSNRTRDNTLMDYDKLLFEHMLPNSKIEFIQTDITNDSNADKKIFVKSLQSMFVVTEEGFGAFKKIYDHVNKSTMFPHRLSVHFVNKIGTTTGNVAEPFVYKAVIVLFKIEATTAEHLQFQMEQYLTSLVKAFQKGYEHAIA